MGMGIMLAEIRHSYQKPFKPFAMPAFQTKSTATRAAMPAAKVERLEELAAPPVKGTIGEVVGAEATPVPEASPVV